jgi:aminomethyltransferase
MAAELKQIPLREVHLRCGARLVPFGGWEMPVQYRGISEEYQAVRSRAGVFDVSHMGQILVKGPGALGFLQQLLPPDLGLLALGRLSYAVMCDERGGAVDDLMVYRLGAEEYLLVVNAARLEEDWAWIKGQAEGVPGMELADQSPETGMLAIQGPQAAQAVASLGGSAALELDYLQCARVELAGWEVLISRSGYTGEDGFEILCSTGGLDRLWEGALRQGVQPCGLGARDVLRTEMGYCLYGHELSPERTPLAAGLGWSLSLDKEGGFIGAAVLSKQREEGGYERLAGLRLEEQGIPRPACQVLDEGGRSLGKVSSGTYSPGLERGIALAYLSPQHRKPGTRLWIDLRGKARRAEVVRLPFVPARIRRTKGT